jgi:hypothetical protein
MNCRKKSTVNSFVVSADIPVHKNCGEDCGFVDVSSGSVRWLRHNHKTASYKLGNVAKEYFYIAPETIPYPRYAISHIYRISNWVNEIQLVLYDVRTCLICIYT